MYNEPVFKAYSLLIGKEPLLPYLFAVFGSSFGDFLLGSRLVSVFFGFLTFLGLYLFSKDAFDKKIAVLIAIFYIISPFNLFFDRLAVLDSGINAVAVWSLYLTYLIIKKPKWWQSMVLGGVIACGLYIKTSSFFFLFLPLISALLVFLPKFQISKNKNMVIGVSSAAFIFAIFLYLPLYFSEYYKIHLELLKQYTYPFTSFFSFPFSVWISNFSSLILWSFYYLTPFLFFTAILGFNLLRKNPKYFFIFLWFLLPMLYEIFFAKLFTSRHILILTIPLVIFTGWAVSDLVNSKRKLASLILVGIIFFSMIGNYFILFKPSKISAFMPSKYKGDVDQYLRGFSSGYGVVEAINYIKEISAKENITVIIRNDHGNPEDAVVAYLAYNQNIRLILISDVKDFEQINSQQDLGNAFFVSRGAYFAGMEKYLSDEKKFLKPEKNEFVGVYRVKLKEDEKE